LLPVNEIKVLGPTVWVLAVILLFFIWLVRWILRDLSTREKKYQETINNHIKSSVNVMRELENDLKELARQNEEAHKYQREEHIKQISSLDKISVVLNIISGKINKK